MRLLRSLVLLGAFLGCTGAQAITVSISYLRRPICTYSNGELRANATGGVGPYRYLWSTGDTTQVASDLVAGSYSVTVTDFNNEEASANYNLISTSYNLFELSIFGQHGRCDSVDRLVLDTYDVPGPAPYFVNGVEMAGSGSLYWYEYVPQVNDTQYVFTFEDSNGCVGTVRDYVGWPMEFPEVTVLEILGSCTNDSSGSVTVQLGPEGHGQETHGFLNGVIGDCCPGELAPNATGTYRYLPPGDYVFRQLAQVNAPPFAYVGCVDSSFITIPDIGPGCGSVRGRSYLDTDQDCAPAEYQYGMANVLYEILPGPYYTMSLPVPGEYALQLPIGNYTIEQVSNTLDPWCTPGPLPFEVVGLAGPVHVDFADTSLVLPSASDIEVLIASGAARPGFDMQYAIDVRNLDDGYSGPIVLTMVFDPILEYIGASSTPASVSGNTLVWNINSIGGMQRYSYRVDLRVPPDIQLLGTVLNAAVTVAPSLPDINPANNMADLPVVVSGAYDPNDKLAKTSTRYSDSLYLVGADAWIDYTIRFQNTGTDTAFNVVITDTLSGNLDLRKFIPGPSSHPYELSIRTGTTLRFAFYRIQLPDSNVNEAASHGFVSFRIAPKEPLVPGEEIVNTANIYFDFNPPVITEPSVLVAEFSTPVTEERSTAISIFPNPASEHIIILGDNVDRIRLIGTDGRVRFEAHPVEMPFYLDVRQLANGPYLIEVLNNEGMRYTNIIIKN